MRNFQLIQDDAGFVWRYYGASPPDGHKWYKEAGSGRNKIAGDWKENVVQDTQVPIVESCVGENAGRVRCLVYSRVVGYITPVNLWNKGKKQEWKERSEYYVPSVPRLKAMSSVS